MLPKSDAQEYMANTVESILAETGCNKGRLRDELWDLFENYDFAVKLYQPDAVLAERIDQYFRWCDGESDENPGQLMEELAYLTFRCIKGVESVKSFQSYAAQHDLIISGSSPPWFMLMTFLHLDPENRTIVVEAKNEQASITDAQFSRLCSIVQNKISTCRLGVFFSRQSASGFPNRDSEYPVRQRTLTNARATQVLFRAKTDKFVIVLDHDDITRLKEPGSLLRLLEAKIRDVDEASGIPLDLDINWREVDLPPHLARHDGTAA